MKTLQILLISVLATSIWTGCAKYRIKKKDAKNTQEILDNGKLSNPNLGKEVKDGESTTYYGTDGIFWAKATPHTVNINENISFSGNCGANNEGQLSWDLGDNEKNKEDSFSHSYKTAGTYKVKVSCTESGKDGLSGTLTITVKDPGPLNPNQNPNQSPNQSGASPSQNK